MVFFEVIKNFFRSPPDQLNELTRTVATLEAEKNSTSREVAILKSRVFVHERQNSSLCTQVTEKEKRLVEANIEIALVKEQQSQEKEMSRSHINFLQSLNTSLLTEVSQKTTALFEAKSDEANLQKQCEELKMEKKKLEDRTTIKVKVVPTVNIKPEPEIEREVKDDNIKVNVDQRPRTLIVFGLGPLIREKDLLEEFEVFGRLEGATIVMDRKDMASLSFLILYGINS